LKIFLSSTTITAAKGGIFASVPALESKVSEAICRNLRIHGRVQGVGYRWSLSAEAKRLGLTGWVRNRRDGSVEALVSGPPEAIDALVVWAHRGPPMARVDSVWCNEGNAGELGTRSGFVQIATR
jgi:acylphosphatase